MTNTTRRPAPKKLARNLPVAATYYSLAHTKEAVILLARWYDDDPTKATCWTEIDREFFVDGQPTDAAWKRIKGRNEALLRVQASQ
jgi:hypothetical protein